MEAIVALFTLVLLEVVLGIDNIVFLSILCGKLPEEERPKARFFGLALALAARVAFLLSITWIMKLTAPLFAVTGHSFSGKDLVLLLGGFFLVGKAAHEIHDKVEHPPGKEAGPVARRASFISVIIQVGLMDIIFSIDSVITAVGMVRDLWVMVVAVVVAIAVMMVFAGAVGDFVERHPAVKLLALAFLVLVGSMLLAEGFGHHVPKAYVYLPMGFAGAVVVLDMRRERNAKAMVGGISGRSMPEHLEVSGE